MENLQEGGWREGRELAERALQGCGEPAGRELQGRGRTVRKGAAGV